MTHLLRGLEKGLVFIVSAPAGTGKTTLIRMLTQEFDTVVESISYTTRKMRPGEEEGKDYYFIDEAKFQEMVANGDFLEYAHVFDHYYGTSRKVVEGLSSSGKHVVLIIDTQGAKILKNVLDAIYIFICPPNFEELKSRLHGRQSDTHESISTRLSWAEKEMEASKDYDYLIVNEKLLTAYGILKSILVAEEHRIRLK